jgi:hypothetical protein
MINTEAAGTILEKGVIDPFGLFIISNDVVFGKKQIERAPGDQIINFGRPATEQLSYINSIKLVPSV